MFSPRRTRNIVKSQLPREKLSEKSCETVSHLLLERDQNSYIYDTFSQLAIVREVLHASFVSLAVPVNFVRVWRACHQRHFLLLPRVQFCCFYPAG